MDAHIANNMKKLVRCKSRILCPIKYDPRSTFGAARFDPAIVVSKTL
jgi:hypothetical protein